MTAGYQKIVDSYDSWMLNDWTARYYDNSDFYNYGYWDENTRTQKAACENLMEKLLAFIPSKRGNILDVACGLGATTRHLLRYYPPQHVVGINVSDVQLTRARCNAPGCTFLKMSATELEFEDASFDNIVCVESAFHFDTREQFLKEAHRVLRPGGRLVMSDIISPRLSPRAIRNHHIPAANYLDDPEAHRRGLLRVGFADAEVVDATEACWGGFCRHLERWTREQWRAGSLTRWKYLSACLRVWLARRVLSESMHYYVLISARKSLSPQELSAKGSARDTA